MVIDNRTGPNDPLFSYPVRPLVSSGRCNLEMEQKETDPRDYHDRKVAIEGVSAVSFCCIVEGSQARNQRTSR